MFDFHIHTTMSFDAEALPADVVSMAEREGLKEICFTDHYDQNSDPAGQHFLFDVSDYRAAYDALSSGTVKIRRGVEFGLTTWNVDSLASFTASYPFDFVLGSVHSVGGEDPYFPEYWEGKTARDAFEEYLEQTLACVRLHDGFDVLGHLNYVCKYMPDPQLLRYRDHADLCDEIMRVLAEKGKGMEINTSGFDRVGAFLPDRDFLLRFKELGGEIVTVGSDAHQTERVGQYTERAVALAKELFGYVCTFEGRKPIYHYD